MQLAVGTRLRNYEVRSLLGQGGMGEVYLAFDHDLERLVALKVLPADVTGDENRLQRFTREARATSSLNHPNIAHVYAIGTENGVSFMAMEYIEGETLRTRLRRSSLPIRVALDMAVQIAAALSVAHKKDIVHRDMKPENVMIRTDGIVKVVDFGLARSVAPASSKADEHLTKAGSIVGTVSYMSPEQLKGVPVDPRSDIFSFGVVLYEMLTRHRPFEAPSDPEKIAAILSSEPVPVTTRRQDLPPGLHEIVTRALAKDRSERYDSIDAMARDLRSLPIDSERVFADEMPTAPLPTPADSVTLMHSTAPVRDRTARSRRRIIIALVAIAAILAVAIPAVIQIQKNQKRTALVATLDDAERLAGAERYKEALALATAAAPGIPADNVRLQSLLDRVSDLIAVKSNPPGADVSITHLDPRRPDTPPRFTVLGETPLRDVRIARGDFLLLVSKKGYAPVEMPLSTMPFAYSDMVRPAAPVNLDLELRPESEVPPEMVYIPGGSYRLTGWGRPTDERVSLSSFLIDRYEVSNREFKQFVDAGGYRKRELWQQLYQEKGEKEADEIRARLVDSTGVPAPRGWKAGTFANAEGDLPVSGVTWYEAAAFAAFRRKELPTIYQWDKAARNGVTSSLGYSMPWGILKTAEDVTVRANFRATGPMPVQSLPWSMSRFGVYHTAGNVEEWLHNEGAGGRYRVGAAWDDPVYIFGNYGVYPPEYSSPRIGFRCARRIGETAGPDSAKILPSWNAVRFVPVASAEFKRLASFYSYDTSAPLNATVESVAEASEWTRQKVSYAGGRIDRASAWLYLPRHAKPPFQVVFYAPAGDVTSGARSLDASIEHLFSPHIRAGRAVFSVVSPGFIGRPAKPTSSEEERVRAFIADVVEMRRGVDYLITRDDIDPARIAFLGRSAGSVTGVILAGTEERFASVALVSAGLRSSSLALPPEIAGQNFLPRIRGPKLLLHGKYDENLPFESTAKPLFALLSEPKRLITYDGGHIAPFEVVIPTLEKWWDETLGPVTK